MSFWPFDFTQRMTVWLGDAAPAFFTALAQRIGIQSIPLPLG